MGIFDDVKVNVTLDQVTTALTVLRGIAQLFFELKEKAERDGAVTKEDYLEAIASLNERQAAAMKQIEQEIKAREDAE